MLFETLRERMLYNRTSKHSSTRSKKSAKDKRILRDYRTLDRLGSQIDGDEVREPLPEPVFWGYRKTLVLKDHLKNDPLNQRLLAICDLNQDCKRKDFKHRDPQTRKWVELSYGPKSLNETEFEKLDDALKKHFHVHFESYVDTKGREHTTITYAIVSPEIFRVQRTKLWITSQVVPNGEAQSEAAKIHHRLWKEGEIHRLDVINRKGNWRRGQPNPESVTKALKRNPPQADRVVGKRMVSVDLSYRDVPISEEPTY